MSEGNSRLSTTERVIKGTWRAGPSSGTRWERPRAGRRFGVGGREGGSGGGGAEGGGGGPGGAARAEHREGVWEPEAGIPAGLPAGASGGVRCT